MAQTSSQANTDKTGRTKSRKGARNRSEIAPEVLLQLNQGQIETVNLVECLAVDMQALLENLCEELKLPLNSSLNNYSHSQATNLKIPPELGFTARLKLAGEILFQLTNQHPQQAELLPKIYTHSSDTVRSWGAHLCVFNFIEGINIQRTSNSDGASESCDKLQKLFTSLRPFALDFHFGVREIAWLAVRDILIEKLEEGLEILQDWINDESPYARRFACELTRPRGVWCKHINTFKQDPTQGLKLVIPLHHDSNRYVQNSFANWLNDASKSHPEVIQRLCQGWQEEVQTFPKNGPSHKHIAYIIKRSLRTINKKQT